MQAEQLQHRLTTLSTAWTLLLLHCCTAVLLTAKAEPAPGSSSQLVQTRRGHGSVAMREAAVLVNLFRLTVNGQVLYHYDVSYARLRPARSRDPGALSGGGGGDLSSDEWVGARVQLPLVCLW